jgi:hypothetical protein
MSMLDRIKKRQYLGFKEFVQNMETTGSIARQPILLAGILEDPVFMTHVMKNVRTFDDFLNLPSNEIDTVLTSQEQIIGILAKCLFGGSSESLTSLEFMIPKHIGRLKDQLSYLSAVSASEKEGAKYFILKVVRKLQAQENIQGFHWKLPPNDIFFPKVYRDGEAQIYFESGILAAEGSTYKGKKNNSWKHYYDTGKLMAEGDYEDGLKTGVWAFYFGNGCLRSQGLYENDVKLGKWKDWDRSGLMTETEFHEGLKKKV